MRRQPVEVRVGLACVAAVLVLWMWVRGSGRGPRRLGMIWATDLYRISNGGIIRRYRL